MIISVFDRVENIVGNGEIACTSNFSFSYNVFKRLACLRGQKVMSEGYVGLCLCGEKLKNVHILKYKEYGCRTWNVALSTEPAMSN